MFCFKLFRVHKLLFGCYKASALSLENKIGESEAFVY